MLLGAVETGGTTIRCARGDGPGALDDVVSFPTGAPEDAVGRIAAYFAAGPRVEQLGVAAFGPLGVDPGAADWGQLLKTPKPGWSGFALGARLREAVGAPVVIDSDVNAAALAEATTGAGRGARPLVYLTVGTGVGMGAVVGESTLRGLLHPEAGHLRLRRLPRDDFAGACPYHGDCWEGMVCGPAIAARTGREASELADDDPVWELVARYVAAGLQAITLVLSPQRIVMGGGVGGRAGVRDRVRELLPGLLAGGLDRPADAAQAAAFLVAPHHRDAGLAGAMALAAAAVS